jgi:hypothetical protein
MVRVETEDVLVEIPSEERMGDTVTEDETWEPYGSRSGKLDEVAWMEDSSVQLVLTGLARMRGVVYAIMAAAR